MRISLADQTGSRGAPSLAIALGANLPSASGDPIATLTAVRPLLEVCVQQWSRKLPQPAGPTRFRWSPLFETEPVGGPPGQPRYINAVVLVDGLTPHGAAAEALLTQLQGLEHQFGRERQTRWEARSLDLDLLWWGQLRCHTPLLQLPHPLWQQRDFVLAPLVALGELAGSPDNAAVALAGRPGWPEPLEPEPTGSGPHKR